MDRVQILAHKRDELQRELEALNAPALREERKFTAEEYAKHGLLLTKLEAAETALVAEKAQLEHDRHHGVPIASAEGMTPAKSLEGVPGAAMKYRDLFGAASKNEHFPTVSDFLEAVASGRFHPGLKAAMNEGVGSEGGFLTPTEYASEFFDESLESEVVRPRARVYGMMSDTKKISGFEMDGDTATGPFGFVPSWTGEGAAITPTTPLVRRVTLTAKKLALLVQASNELAEDGLNYGAQLERTMRSAVGWSLDYAFLQGNGAGEPLGVLNAPACIEVAKEAGQAASSVVADNIYKMYARLLASPGAYRRAVWVCSPTVVPTLFKLSIPVGVGGTSLASVPSLFALDGGKMSLLNLPVVTSEKMPILGAAGDIGLFDFAYYAIGLRREVTVDRSQHVGFASDLASFRAVLRADGLPLLSQPYQPKAGDTLSPFVKLGARA